MTVNADIYLPEPVFSHGQLCVALSTSIARQNVSILAILDFGNKKKNSDTTLSFFIMHNYVFRIKIDNYMFF